MKGKMSAIFSFIEIWIDERGEDGLDQAVWERFGCERTVLVVDMAGFTVRTRRRGVVHYMTLIRRMRTFSRGLLSGHDGQLVRFEADNLFAVFPTPAAALGFIVELMGALDEDNAARPPDDHVHLCAGLDHGAILLDQSDFYGAAVNMASKLGEDLARPNEVLVTKAIAEMTAEASFVFEEVGSHDFGGTAEPTYRLVMTRNPAT